MTHEAQAIAALAILAAATLAHGLRRVDAALSDLAWPGTGDNPHHEATTFGGHVIVGACVVAAVVAGLGALGLALPEWAPLAVALAYWAAKELRDLRRGGNLWDGVVDAVGVGIGALYAGPWWWPFLALAFMGFLMVRAQR